MATRLLPDVAPLRTSREFRLVFASRTVTALGTQAAEVAVIVQAKQITGSELATGLLGMAELGPLIVFGLYGGTLADRFDRRALIRWCEAGLGVSAILLLVNALLPRPQLWPLYALAAVAMAIASLQRPSLEASLPRLVAREQLTAAATLQSMSQNANFLAGSALGGLLAVTPGPWLVYAVDVAGFAASFVLLSMLPVMRVDSGGPEPAPSLRAIRDGLRYAIGRRDLLGSYLADLSAMFFAYPNALYPFVAADLHATWATGLMYAAPSAGAFGVSLLSGWMGRVRRHGLAIALAGCGWGLGIAAFGIAPGVWLALLALVLAGGADMVSGIFRDTFWNQTIPDSLRGRMAGVELLSYGVGPPAGQLRGGLVASLTSARVSLVSGGLACVGAVGLVCAALPALTRYRAEDRKLRCPAAQGFRRAPGPRGQSQPLPWRTMTRAARLMPVRPRHHFVTM